MLFCVDNSLMGDYKAFIHYSLAVVEKLGGDMHISAVYFRWP